MISNSTARFAGLLALSALVGAAVAPHAATAQTPPKKAAPAPTKKPTAEPAPKLPPTVVARVNGKDITREDLLGLFDTVHGRPLIGELVKDTVIADEAKRLGVVITQAELNAAIQKTKLQIVAAQQQRGTSMTYEQFALEQGITETFLRWSVYEETLRKDTFAKVIAAQIPALDSQIKVAHILIATIPLGSEQPAKPPTEAEQQKIDADAKTKIDGILADIKAKKITFEDAAKQYSADQSNASTGGLLPFAGRGTFDPTFEGAAWNLKNPGDISEPVKSRFGWHLIKLVTKGTNATAAEKKAYHDDMVQKAAQQAENAQAIQSWTSQLMGNAKITINPSPMIVSNPKNPLTNANIAKK